MAVYKKTKRNRTRKINNKKKKTNKRKKTNRNRTRLSWSNNNRTSIRYRFSKSPWSSKSKCIKFP